jgi:hypothetical protein
MFGGHALLLWYLWRWRLLSVIGDLLLSVEMV